MLTPADHRRIVMRGHYDAVMRTTIDLPEDLHRIASGVARDQGTSLSEAVAQLLRRAIGEGGSAETATSRRTGMPTIRLGRPITSEDVRALDDDS